MLSNAAPHIVALTKLREAAGGLEIEASYQACMESAARLVEDAAYKVAEITPGTNVVELLFLAARIEEIGKSTAHIEKALSTPVTPVEGNGDDIQETATRG